VGIRRDDGATADRTGVEMEALTAVTVAALALIDMIKAVDPAAVISDVRVEEKTGGKTGGLASTMIRALAHHDLEPGRRRGLRRPQAGRCWCGCCALRVARWTARR